MFRFSLQMLRRQTLGNKFITRGIIKPSHATFAQILEKVQNINEDDDSFKISEEKVELPFQKLDLFQTNLKLENPPDNIITYNDLDDGLISEILKELDISNVSTIVLKLLKKPLIIGRISRIFCFTEDFIHSIIMYLSNDCGFGIGLSTVIFATTLRLVLSPIYIINYKFGQLNKLITPDINELNKNIKELRRMQKHDLVRIESNKLSQLRERHGIKQSKIRVLLGGIQMLILLVWAGLVQRFSINIDDYPEVMTGGFLWFKDLTMSDPYFILPLINSILIILNISCSSGIPGNKFFIKMRKFLVIFPLLTFPFFCTLETGFLLYLTSTSLISFLITLLAGRKFMKTYLKIPAFLPGTKLERLNPMTNIGNSLSKVDLNKRL